MVFEGKEGKEAMIKQGYLPATCTLSDQLAGPLAWSEIQRGRNPCWGCNHDRGVCKGQPKSGGAEILKEVW